MGELTEPENIVNEQWRNRLRRALDEIDAAADDLAGHAPASGTENIHDLEVQAATSMRRATRLVWQGAVEVDPNLFFDASAVLDDSLGALESMNAAIRGFCG